MPCYFEVLRENNDNIHIAECHQPRYTWCATIKAVECLKPFSRHLGAKRVRGHVDTTIVFTVVLAGYTPDRKGGCDDVELGGQLWWTSSGGEEQAQETRVGERVENETHDDPEKLA